MNANRQDIRANIPMGSAQSEGGGDLSDDAYNQFERFLFSRCGIKLGTNKRYLVISRLERILRDTGISSLNLLIANLCNRRLSSKVELDVIDAMTTNETFWFREAGHFDELANIVAANQSNTFRIWCAGCSSGQEPYSLSMAIEDHRTGNNYAKSKSYQVLGTDISESALDIARRSVYSDLEISRGLTEALKTRHFYSTQEGWKISGHIQSKVRFQAFNLLDPFFSLGQFDIIFCRNVLIYFPEETKIDILTRMSQILKPGGYLFLSNTEAMPIKLNCFKLVSGRKVRYYQIEGLT